VTGPDRRSLLKLGAAGGVASVLAPAGRALPAASPPRSQSAPADVTGSLARWATSVRYEDLPDAVIVAAKRFVLDSVGCAYAGWQTEKGRRAAETMLQLGGERQARVWGTNRRIAATHAAFANAELMNALDFDAIPHTPPVTLPAIFAIAEMRGKSGREVLTAVVVAHEIAARLSAASSQMQASLNATGATPEVFGINNEGIIATAAALSGLLGMEPARAIHAIGLAAYYCPPQVSHDWETLSTKTNVKYTPVGWVSQGSVTAALLAETGFTSNPAVFEGTAGFARFYGWPVWRPEVATRGLGSDWRILSVDYKPHAACRFIHSQIDCMESLVAQHRFTPDQIASIQTLGVPFVAHPDPMNVTTQEDAQFSTPYNVALAACGIPIDANAQSPDRIGDSLVRATMAKIAWGVHPGTRAAKAQDPRSYIARVTVRLTDGRALVQEALYARGTSSQPDLRLSDDALNEKFVANGAGRLGKARARTVADRIWAMDALASVGGLF